MKEVFSLLFRLRHVKKEKLEVSLRNFITILRSYRKMIRYIKFKDYYIYVLVYSIQHKYTFQTSIKEVQIAILENQLNKWQKKM